MLHKVVLTLKSWNGTLNSNVTIQIEGTDEHFLVERFIMLCKVVVCFASTDEILKRGDSNENH